MSTTTVLSNSNAISQPRKLRRNIRSSKYSKNSLSRHILKQLEPIYEDEVSCSENKENSDSLGNVILEEIFFKECPFRVCGTMKVTDLKMALDVKMSMQFTNDFWKTFDESPIVCQPKFCDTIEFEVEIPQKVLKKDNIDFRVCSNLPNSTSSIVDTLQ